MVSIAKHDIKSIRIKTITMATSPATNFQQIHESVLCFQKEY
jgi:hypothetical protein